MQPLIVIVAYNSDDHLRDCLAALAGAGPTVVVDNGQQESTRALAEAARSRYLQPSTNLGFAGGVNLALQQREKDRDILLVNPDARISKEQVLDLQALLARDSSLAATAPRLIYPDGKDQRTMWPMPTPASPWLGAIGLGRLSVGRRFLSGAVLLLSGRAVDSVGPFDETYFLYAEEADWQLRAQRAGWRIAVHPGVTAVHVGGGSSDDAATRELRFHTSAELFVRKWYGSLGWQVFRWGAVLAALRRAAFARDPAGRATHADVARLYLRRSHRTARRPAGTAGT